MVNGYTKAGRIKNERAKIKKYQQRIKDNKFMIKLHRDNIRREKGLKRRK